jgi:hypothetical protein
VKRSASFVDQRREANGTERTKERTMAGTRTFEMDCRELAHRCAHGIEVTLLWIPCEDAIAVRVVERDAGTSFELAVERDRALDAFHHPYAYAALEEIRGELSLRPAA